MPRNEENREYAKSFLDGLTADLLVLLSGHPHYAIIHLGFRLEKGGGRRGGVENTTHRLHCYSSVILDRTSAGCYAVAWLFW